MRTRPSPSTMPPTCAASSARERSITLRRGLLLLGRRGGGRRGAGGLDLVLLVVGADQLVRQVERVRRVGDAVDLEDHGEPLLLGDGGDDVPHLLEDGPELVALLLRQLLPALLEALLEVDQALLHVLGLLLAGLVAHGRGLLLEGLLVLLELVLGLVQVLLLLVLQRLQPSAGRLGLVELAERPLEVDVADLHLGVRSRGEGQWNRGGQGHHEATGRHHVCTPRGSSGDFNKTITASRSGTEAPRRVLPMRSKKSADTRSNAFNPSSSCHLGRGPGRLRAP